MRVKGVNRRKFRQAVVDASGGCTLQHDGWPCGSDFPGNQEDWHAVLAYRGDYDGPEVRIVKADGSVVYKMTTDIVYKQDGTFSHHVFVEIPEDEIKRRIQALAQRLKED